MELKEIEQEIQSKFIDFMKNILPYTELEYFKAIMPKGILIEFIQSYGQSQYNQALEDLESRHVDYQLVGHTYITVNTKTIQELKIPTK